jgi:adenylosuccinate synthase
MRTAPRDNARLRVRLQHNGPTRAAKAAEVNGATEIALTFADYLDKDNQDARRYDQLQPPTMLFIEEIERVSGISVTLICTRFNARSVIDRRLH